MSSKLSAIRRPISVLALGALAVSLHGACAEAADASSSQAPPDDAAPAKTQPPRGDAAQQRAQPSRDDASQPRKPAVSTAKPPSPNATINLVNALVKQGALTEEQAAALIKQADQEAYVARESVKSAAAKAESADKNATAAASAASPPGTKHVTYVPEIVKRELREGIREEVLDKAKKEGWATPNTYPEWTNYLKFHTDFWVRYERIFFPRGNDNSGTLINFNAINTGNPFDLNQVALGILPPVRDVDQDRTRVRASIRFGVDVDLKDGFGGAFRIATGDSSAPISTFQTLGGGGGNFSKYPIWIDRGYLNYQTPDHNLAVELGRTDNPFFSPDDLIWYTDLGFDGAAARAKTEIVPGVVPFIAGGAFALYSTPLNFPNNGTGTALPSAPLGANLWSENRYLFGIQGGLGVQKDDVSLKVAGAYFDFSNVQGRISSLCEAAIASDSCSTDLLRPSYAQYGNTYMLLRNIDPAIATNFQFFGLASQFRTVQVNGQLDLGQFKPAHVILDGDYVNNVAFDRKAVAAIAVNNRGAGTIPGGVVGPFIGGNVGAMGRLTIGYPVIDQAWAWNAYVAYKYLQSDAIVDAFTDNDFGLGGTNLKGYIVGARLGLNQNVYAAAKWLSANAIVGPPFAVDVFQFDIRGRF
jgi:hypothetical protein